jgi:hypothetical protein
MIRQQQTDNAHQGDMAVEGNKEKSLNENYIYRQY